MGKGIYTYYKERLVEIGGSNKCLYLKNMVRRGAYDIGKIFEGRDDKVEQLIDFLISGKRDRLTLICEEETRDIVKNIGMPVRREADTSGKSLEEIAKASVKNAVLGAEDSRKILDGEVSKIKDLCREIEDIERETGRYELYIGYPFVFGTLNQGPKKMLIKAPLLLFPVKVDFPDERTVEICINGAEKTQINRALIFAYAQAKRINIDELALDFDDLSDFKSVKQIVDYLSASKIKIECASSNHVYEYTRFKEPDGRGDLSVRYAAVLGRFPISNSIYNDYTLLEKKNLTNDAINELLRTDKSKAKKKLGILKNMRRRLPSRRTAKANRTASQKSYTVKMLDYAQSEVVRRVDECGNVVIYGPPGTGKSQTIVNIITDAMAKSRRVLVVSQKKAALDVVFSRLGTLNEKAMYINDENRSKKEFYERCFETHKRELAKASKSIEKYQSEYDELEEKIKADTELLDGIYHTLSDKREFGLSLLDMYSSSYMPNKNSTEYAVYLKLAEAKDVTSLSYKELSDALFAIKAKDLSHMYYDFLVAKEKNPLIDSMKPDLDIRTLNEVKSALDIVHKRRRAIFNISDYPYLRQALAFYQHLDRKKNVKSIIKLQAKLERQTHSAKFKSCAEINEKFAESVKLIDSYAHNYDCLARVMTRDGFISVIDNLIRGNTGYIKLVYDLIENYISIRDIGKLLDSIDKNMSAILNFAYGASKNYQGYLEIIDKLLVLRIYHELVGLEDGCKEELSKLLDFNNVSSRIYKQKEAQLSVAAKICSIKSSAAYKQLYDTSENSKDYLYQIEKEQKFWPIRKTMDVYGEFVLSLFPCWLLSPENVSSILPLEKNMFDIVIFDEASQVFIESTIPTIYRGKSIVVAGDSKQLRPSATFMKRYMGADPETVEDYSMQAALEVESLLDLAMARYESANLTYHYRSRHQELIDFSNSAFYSGNLQVAPNISANKRSRPIERYKVDGRWLGRTNPVEARKVVDIVRNIIATRKNNESIGIITFNSDQQGCIADAFEAAGKADPKFRAAITKEKQRLENGEDTGLFIKNLENVQGDERDIIIFSIGYAPNEMGKLYTNFGSLSTEGGENRLNVAVTRAKSKIIVVTSIEPEDLRVDTAKNQGPRLLRDYLSYVRAVADGDSAHTQAILEGLCPTERESRHIDTGLVGVELQIKEKLEAAGYTVHTNLGNKNNRISLAVYDNELDRYLVGVELDRDAFDSSESALERDVYKPKFLEAHGWHILRVWCRDWWLYPARVIKTITNAAEKSRESLKK